MAKSSKMTPRVCAAANACCGPELSGGAGAAPLPSSGTPDILDPLQTTSRSPVAIENWAFLRDCLANDSVPFEHTGWHNTRMKILAAMEATDAPLPRATKFVACGDDTFVYENTTTGEVDYHGSRCGDRFCMICGQARSRRIAHALAGMLEKEAPLFITFTVRGKVGDTLAGQIDRLTDAWKELRRLKHWRENIRGGAIMLEIKWSTESGGHWHPHYHILAHGHFIEKQWLSDAWRLITRDSDQVDIQRVTDLPKALGYVTKYASKPMDASYTNRPHLLTEAMRTLKGRRLCACFGDWYGTPLNDKGEENAEEIPTFTPWAFVGTCRTLQSKADDGDAHAAKLLQAVERAKRLRYALLDRCRRPEVTDTGPIIAARTGFAA